MSKIPRIELGRFKAIAFGASTGAPGQVEMILQGLSADLPVPLFVAQHMPPNFTNTYSARLQLCTPLTVVHAEDQMPVYESVVYVGRGHHHLRVKRFKKSQALLDVSVEPEELPYKPSADELFRSCVEVYGDKVLAVVMSGIGNDGTEGARCVREAGGMVLTQARETCAVYGMPRSCVEADLSNAQLTPDEIFRTIAQLSPEYVQRETA